MVLHIQWVGGVILMPPKTVIHVEKVPMMDI